jgi:two-component system chemotaxis sensor kinase CheA
MEDIFYYLREERPSLFDFSGLLDLVLAGIDFIKGEVEKIKSGKIAEGDSSSMIDTMNHFLVKSKDNNKLGNNNEASNHSCRNTFKAVIYYDDGCEMENIRAYTILHNLKDLAEEVICYPEDIIEHEESIEAIRLEGFLLYLKTALTYEKMWEFFNRTIFLKDLELIEIQNEKEFQRLHSEKSACNIRNSSDNQENYSELNMQIKAINHTEPRKAEARTEKLTKEAPPSVQQSIISVSVAKLDRLLDLVGEMVIAEAMVIQNPDLFGLELDNFDKAARQLNKITNEMQDTVMSIRMVPLSTTFHKMHRIVRDMCRKLMKEVKLEIIGEETEVDKNIIEHISDPLMHLVRNAVDHGLETTSERLTAEKPGTGTITLEAKNVGSDVLIIIRDDGIGLDKDKIILKAKKQGLLNKSADEMTDKEIFNLILLPGFSTKDSVTEFSGRGVGMDVVTKNIELVGGTISVDSVYGKGTVITLKIPLTLAIIDGMNIRVGKSCYTIPIISIKESFRPKEKDIITDPDGNEMIMVRGQCIKVLRLHEIYNVKTDITDLTKGIIIMAEQDEKNVCILADELIGQQQVVVKTLPKYIQSIKRIRGLSGCTLLGDGSISLILDVSGFIAM